MTNKTTPKKLFNNLMRLADENEAFYFSDQNITINGKDYIIRSFTYRLASWSDFQDNINLDSRESRGTAFYTEADKNDWELFCRAYPKFWNLGEGIPVDDFVSEHKPYASFEKMDGSLILFGRINGKVIAKSKTSINSDQAKMAQDIYDNNKSIKSAVNYMINLGITPVFELVGPDNVIVLRYDENKLVLLGQVDNDNGNVVPAGLLEKRKYSVDVAEVYKHNWDELLEIKETSKPNIEGFVVLTEDGEMVKVKVNSYIQLHHLKDSVNNVKSLALLILDDNLDDLIGSFQDDQKTVDYIVEMQEKIGHKYNHLVAMVEEYTNKNKELDRKEFAIKTQKEMKPFMSLCMSLYLGKEVNFKEFFMKTKMYEND